MKRFSGFSAALLVVFMAHMVWAQERGGKPRSQARGGSPPQSVGHEQGVGGGISGGCMAVIASVSMWVDSFSRRRRTITTLAATGCGIATTS
jgi:hypothetical protein